jgi:hypothetical protein
VHAQVPVDVATFLLNEKRAAINRARRIAISRCRSRRRRPRRPRQSSSAFRVIKSRNPQRLAEDVAAAAAAVASAAPMRIHNRSPQRRPLRSSCLPWGHRLPMT